MCLCTLCTGRFLDRVGDSDVFRVYCGERAVPLPFPGRPSPEEASARWLDAIGRLPDDLRARIAWEQAAVNELGVARGTAHLLAASGAGELPAPGVPDGGPLALWFLLYRPALFREVFYRHRRREPDVWHARRATPGVLLTEAVTQPLVEGLGEWFRRHGGERVPSLATLHRLPSAVSLVARGAGRPATHDAINPQGGHLRQPLRPAISVQFVYYPQDGTVLLKAPPFSPDFADVWLDRFSRDLLGSPPDPAAGCFAIDRLRYPFRPLADDVEMACVRALHLRHPARAGGRTLILQSLTSDAPSAIEEMVERYVAPGELPELTVSQAELHVRLETGGRKKDHLVRLWPDRCDLGPGPAGDRILSALRRWGL